MSKCFDCVYLRVPIGPGKCGNSNWKGISTKGILKPHSWLTVLWSCANHHHRCVCGSTWTKGFVRPLFAGCAKSAHASNTDKKGNVGTLKVWLTETFEHGRWSRKTNFDELIPSIDSLMNNQLFNTEEIDHRSPWVWMRGNSRFKTFCVVKLSEHCHCFLEWPLLLEA